jgi:hypothetical protein
LARVNALITEGHQYGAEGWAAAFAAGSINARA